MSGRMVPAEAVEGLIKAVRGRFAAGPGVVTAFCRFGDCWSPA